MSTQKKIPYLKKDVRAIKALFKGEATPEQQLIALNCIMNDICQFHHPAPSEFVERWLGRREVILDLIAIKNIKVENGDE